MQEYSENDLHHLWRIEEDIYLQIEKICEKYNFHFFAGYGSAIGVMRHQGFIPWDDDMDMCMPRDDYEKFLEVAPKELDEKYELLEARKTKGYVLPFAKIIRKDSTFIEATDEDRKYHSGIFVDIFPLDKVSKEYKERKAVERKSWIIARLMVLCEYPKPKLPSSMNGIKKNIAYLGCGVIHSFLKLFRQTPAKLQQKYSDLSLQHKAETDLYTDFVLYKYEENYGKTDVTYKEDELFPCVKKKFEDISIYVPKNCDAYLKKTYGEYMQLPPVEKRHSHFPSKLIFPKDE